MFYRAEQPSFCRRGYTRAMDALSFATARPTSLPSLRQNARSATRPRRLQPLSHSLTTVRACVAPAAARSAVIRSGIEAAIDDYVTSGSNVALGGGDPCSTAAIVEALAVRWETGALVDVAFRPVSPAAAAAAADFNLPTDFSVNYTPTIDLYLAHVSQLDRDLNAAIGGHDTTIGSERFAASLASKQVLVVHEADYSASTDGILSFPVSLDPMLPRRAAELIRKDKFLADAGVRDVVLQDGAGGLIADVLLSPRADIFSIDVALRAMPGVTASGILLSSERVTAVCASEDTSYDITSTLSAIVYLASRPLAELKRLEGEERAKAVERLGKGWTVSTDGQAALVREFQFSGPDRAQVFLSRVMETGALASSFPDIQVTFNSVSLRLSTVDAGGITELDIAMARELSRLCATMRGCDG
jgi:4a-hydroxytetrahydrobiopterin dehydratase